MHFVKFFTILILTCLLLSCSLVKTAYNKAPELTIWWLDDYFNFTQAQNLVLKPALQNLYNWHRKTQLPNYITLLQDMQTSLANDQLSTSQACEQIDAIKLSIRTIQIESIPIIVEMAPLLSDKQLNRFQTKLQKRTEEWKDEWYHGTAEEQLKVRLEKTEDFAEKVYGSLSESQYKLLKQSLKSSSINPAISYQEIIRRNEDAYQILTALQKNGQKDVQKNTLTTEEKTQLVKAGFERIQNSSNQEYQSYADAIAKNSCETIANLHAATSAKQKLHAKNWVQNYIDQLTALQIKS